MSDIVERLQMLQTGAAWVCEETSATLEDAADEIERLRAERDRLRVALERAADALSDAGLLDAWADARTALKETGHE